MDGPQTRAVTPDMDGGIIIALRGGDDAAIARRRYIHAIASKARVLCKRDDIARVRPGHEREPRRAAQRTGHQRHAPNVVGEPQHVDRLGDPTQN